MSKHEFLGSTAWKCIIISELKALLSVRAVLKLLDEMYINR